VTKIDLSKPKNHFEARLSHFPQHNASALSCTHLLLLSTKNTTKPT